MRRRHAWAGCLLVIVCFAVYALGTGSSHLGFWESFEALLNGLPGPDVDPVRQWRLPRVLAALVFGAALAMAGAVFQSLTRNALGSPDIVGFDTGAFTGALVMRIVVGGTFTMLALGALLGGVVTAVVIYVLAFGRGGSTVMRLIVVGIATNAFLASINSWLILSADVEVGISASGWALGSLNNVGWSQLLPATALIVLLSGAVAVLREPLRTAELGDDLAHSLGVRAGTLRAVATVVAVLLTATVTAVSGPIAFVALAAPQVASRVFRRGGFAPAQAGIIGAAGLLMADVVAQRLVTQSPLPVGTVTISVGGAYLVWLIVGESRRRRAVT